MAEPRQKAISLLGEFKRGTGFEAALVSTFNIYFPFLEELVLRRLRTLGCGFVVVLVDAAQVNAELSDPSRRPKLAGRGYALVPVAAPGAFHAKFGLFLGPRSARILVGSHNLTMSGFGLNREVTNLIEVQGRKDREGSAAVQEVLNFSLAWTAKLAPILVKSVEELAVFAQPYQGPIPSNTSFAIVGSRPDGETLWERVLPLLPQSADRVTVVGPFFGDSLSFLGRIRADLRPDEILVGVEPSRVVLPAQVPLESGCRLVDALQLCQGANAHGYLHAKAILIESGTQRTLISGSANPTFAAWLAGPDRRNSELVIVRRLAVEDDDLGLGQLVTATTVLPTTIDPANTRPEFASPGETTRLLVGAASGDSLVIQHPPAGIIQRVEVCSADGEVLPASFTVGRDRLAIEVSRLNEAAIFRLAIADVVYHGWVHHVDILHHLALPPSQRRIRDALGGLSGDPSKLEQLLRMVEKVVFQGPAVEEHGRSKNASSERKERNESESTPIVVLVPTLKGGPAARLRRLSSGDLGLLLDVLMRQLWRSLTHEESLTTRSEGELVGSEEEQLVEEPLTDPRVAELWCKKSATLLRRLTRRVAEGDDKAQVVIQCAAVLGVLEAVRRVEDHDRWRRIQAVFLDRSMASRFIIDAIPQLLIPAKGVLDSATEEAGGQEFAEQEALLRWLIWLAWTVGFGPSELLRRLQDSEDRLRALRALASAGMIAGRVAEWVEEDERTLELLQSTPRAEVRPDNWLREVRSLGQVINDPAAARRVRRPPMIGDLVVVPAPGRQPMFVIAVRNDKVDLLDLERGDQRLKMLANRVEVLDPIWDEHAAPAARAV